MKKLHLIRHAKSSWADSAIADIDRPLNQRGLAACKIMAPQIVKAGCRFEAVFCSPALRAQSTIEQINQALSPQNITWQVDPDLYTFEAQALLRWCHRLNDDLSEVVIVGHNNALTDLINQLGDQPIENLPTCGYAQLAFSGSTWQSLKANSGELVSFLKPKMFN
ncbi:MAG: phosphohistidine phosphatase SixA [Phormidesmis priestleyi Ana]|uniref:Phosphohistidine phosphatase SixA n=1 Tax=Phormidesmis priestleyi Ana TaxID=1666911 RepID=A0A0P7YUG3_9CYAN|nr:MAG: phosphohistidine phosphatase SixA [Phormidesmis priestleyi Ana]